MCPSTGPLLHGSRTAPSTAPWSCCSFRTNRCSGSISVARARVIQRRSVATFPTRRIVLKLNINRRMVVEARTVGFQRIHRVAPGRAVKRARGCPSSAAAIWGET